MNKKENKLRALDALTVYMIALMIGALVGVFAYELIGLWALYACEVLAVTVAFVISKKTRLKAGSWLKFERSSPVPIIGSSLVYASAVLCAIPALLIVQIIVPDFAVSCFHITDALKGHSMKALHIILLILLTAVSETLLFEGYIYTRLKKFDSPLKVALLISAGYAIYQLDLYTLIPLFALEMAIIYIRMKTRSLIIPTVLHIISSTFALAVKDYATDTSELLGTQMGMLQVIGLGMVLIGAALPTAFIGIRLLGDLKKRSFFEKSAVILVSVVLIASGYAIAHIV